MRNENLKPITAYFSPEEYDQVKDEAEGTGVTASALVRAKFGFPVTQRGAPEGNQNRAKINKPSAKKPTKKKTKARRDIEDALNEFLIESSARVMLDGEKRIYKVGKGK